MYVRFFKLKENSSLTDLYIKIHGVVLFSSCKELTMGGRGLVAFFCRPLPFLTDGPILNFQKTEIKRIFYMIMLIQLQNDVPIFHISSGLPFT